MPHLYDNIPPVLKAHLNWVSWGIRGAPPKSPFNPDSLLNGRPAPAKAGIRETWGSYQSAALCVRRGLAQGIGYEFDSESGLYGVDLDHVMNEVGELTPQAREIVGKLKSYTEISPSGTGLHIFIFAPGADITRHRLKDHFLEIYGSGRYFTVTGNLYGFVKALRSRSSELQAVHDEYLLPDIERMVVRLPTAGNTGQERFLFIGLERDKVFRELWEGVRRHSNESADDQALMNKLAYWCNADTCAMIGAFMQSPYYAQKSEAHKLKCQRRDYLPNTAQSAADTVYSTAATEYERWRQNQNRRDAR